MLLSHHQIITFSLHQKRLEYSVEYSSGEDTEITMKLLKLPLLILATGISFSVLADTEPKTNIINLQADASKQVSNDEMHAILFIEKSNKQPAQLSTQMTQLMNQAINISKKYPQVKVETGSQTTYPVYDNNNSTKLKEWRGRAEVNIESKDFKAASQLISELQQDFQTQSINFTVSTEKRKQVENELLTEATQNFQQRAQVLTKAWNRSSYNLVNLNMNTNNYSPRPLAMARAAMVVESAPAADSQNMAAGESTITVNANGSIQLK